MAYPNPTFQTTQILTTPPITDSSSNAANTAFVAEFVGEALSTVGLVLLGTYTANSQATLGVTLPPGFTSYLIICDDWISNTASPIQLRPSINGGTSFPALTTVYYTQRDMTWNGTTATNTTAGTFTATTPYVAPTTPTSRASRPAAWRAELRGWGRAGAAATKYFSNDSWNYMSGEIMFTEFRGTILDASLAGAVVNFIQIQHADGTAFSSDALNVYGYNGI
jgi:hypothetical protein